ncbi:hypothetical protein F4810DRAFT_676962 [Camillea tinctor]|nr:hypothetical protein F4810DRAFT_676962 [Camillea tinctor]
MHLCTSRCNLLATLLLLSSFSPPQILNQKRNNIKGSVGSTQFNGRIRRARIYKKKKEKKSKREKLNQLSCGT